MADGSAPEEIVRHGDRALGRAGAVLALLLLGCSRHPGSCAALPSAPAPTATTTPTEVAKVLDTDLRAPEDDAAESAAYIELVRRRAWDEAEERLDSLALAKQQKPAVRLVRARVAAARGEHQAAAEALAGLEKELPFVAEDIERWRAEAQAEVGPFDQAARYFLQQTGPRAWGRAALAFEKAGMVDEARSAVDKAIAAERQDGAEAPLRSLRARLLLSADQKGQAADDLRFIVVRAPANEDAKAALDALGTLDPEHPLSGKERLVRAERMADAGRVDDALAELDRADKGSLAADKDDVAWGRAQTLYKARGRYEKAAALFSKLGAKPGLRQAEALFYAARARSRADLDEQAAAEYRAVARRFPTSPFADDALYLAARLAFLHASWGKATTQYDAYLQKFPKGRAHDSAEYELAVALLAGGKYEKARAALHELSASATGGEAARLRELEGLAAWRAFDRQGARALWTDVVRSQPLTWGAMLARARLAEVGVPLPPLLESADDKPSEPLSYELPPVALFYHRLGLDAEAEAYLRAHERDVTVAIRGREKEALCGMYGELGRAARGYRIGIEAVPAILLTRAPSASSEWGWRCLYPQPYSDQVRELETAERLTLGLIYAVMRQESAYDPDAVSSAKAVGLLQLMPATARRLAEEIGTPLDEGQLRMPDVNLQLGARYLAKLLRRFEGSIPVATAAYNAGPRAVRRWLDRMKGIDIDLWVALIPYEETRIYVGRVMSNLAHYAYLEGGEQGVPTMPLTLPAVGNEETAEY